MPGHIYQLDSGLTVDFRDSREISILGGSGATYNPISKAQQNQLEEEIKSEYNKGAEVLQQNRQWKSDSSTVIAARHEEVFRQALEITPPNRNRITYSPTEEQKRAAKDLHRLSVNLLEHQYGETISLYRGVRYESPWILESILNNPDRTLHSPPDEKLSSLTNYSSNLNGAAHFHKLILRQESVSPSNIAIASNYLFVYEEGPDEEMYNKNGIYSPNGEVRVRGDEEYPIDETDVFIAISDPTEENSLKKISVRAFLESASKISRREHLVMEKILTPMAKAETEITNEDSQELLRNWESAYNKTFENSVSSLVDGVIA